jgi:hypothetical protein
MGLTSTKPPRCSRSDKRDDTIVRRRAAPVQLTIQSVASTHRFQCKVNIPANIDGSWVSHRDLPSIWIFWVIDIHLPHRASAEWSSLATDPIHFGRIRVNRQLITAVLRGNDRRSCLCLKERRGVERKQIHKNRSPPLKSSFGPSSTSPGHSFSTVLSGQDSSSPSARVVQVSQCENIRRSVRIDETRRPTCRTSRTRDQRENHICEVRKSASALPPRSACPGRCTFPQTPWGQQTTPPSYSPPQITVATT